MIPCLYQVIEAISVVDFTACLACYAMKIKAGKLNFSAVLSRKSTNKFLHTLSSRIIHIQYKNVRYQYKKKESKRKGEISAYGSPLSNI